MLAFVVNIIVLVAALAYCSLLLFVVVVFFVMQRIVITLDAVIFAFLLVFFLKVHSSFSLQIETRPILSMLGSYFSYLFGFHFRSLSLYIFPVRKVQ